MKCIIACSKQWNADIVTSVQAMTEVDARLITKKSELTLQFLDEFKPDILFFPHWSFLIPEEIFSKYECVIFHMTDLPFGRGGSPLQNLIARGMTETKISAFRCEQGLDSGPIYMKRSLSLHGNAEEIFIRAGRTIESMMIALLQEKLVPQPQVGEPVVFQRRTPDEGDLSRLESIDQVYDYIRMLDADGYPPAYLEIGSMRLEFSRASFSIEGIFADVTIKWVRQ